MKNNAFFHICFCHLNWPLCYFHSFPHFGYGSYLFLLMNKLNNVHSNCSLKKIKSICLPIILIFFAVSESLLIFPLPLYFIVCLCCSFSKISEAETIETVRTLSEILPPPPCLHLLSVRQLFLVDHLQNVQYVTVHLQFTEYLGSL